MKIGILGGGLSGLTLGYLLSQKDIDFEILEKDCECGGLMRTREDAGFTFDCAGSHIIFSRNEESLNFILNLLQNNKVRTRRETRVLYDGRYVKYPFENGLSDLSKNDNFDCLFSFVQNLIKKEKGEIGKPVNLQEWFYYTFGSGISEKYLIPYNEKIWKFPTDQMGLDWVERVPDPPMGDIIKSSLGIETEGYRHQLFFYYPRVGGIQAIIKVFEEEIKEHIVTNFEITQVNKVNKWSVSDGKQEKQFDKIVSTIPIQNLINVMNAPKNEKKAVDNLKYNSLICVMIGLNSEKLNDLSWLYIPDKEILTHRISFPSNYSPKVAPKGKSAVLAEITCDKNSSLWNMSDNELKEKVIENLYLLKIIDKSDVCFAEVSRSEYAYVISDLDYKKNLTIAQDYAAEQGLNLLGRFGEFKYMNMDECIQSAMNCANKILSN
jgi:protoporphyrinogen oxidase